MIPLEIIGLSVSVVANVRGKREETCKEGKKYVWMGMVRQGA